jgi:hypothetical protein
MFQRKIISELRLWADSKYRKPLVLRGARQVGKSTMVKEFGKEFDVFISLNLEKPDHLAIFESADIDISVKNHIIGFAAEEARHTDTVQDIVRFSKEHGYRYR